MHLNHKAVYTDLIFNNLTKETHDNKRCNYLKYFLTNDLNPQSQMSKLTFWQNKLDKQILPTDGNRLEGSFMSAGPTINKTQSRQQV